ncbi:MAG: pyridoxal phosphate-dependent aminotransferase [Polyangiaceae bacterium]
MFGRTRYLDWASRHYGKVRFDLASSGMPTVSLAELGVPEATTLSNPSGWSDLREAIAGYNDVPSAEAIAALGTTHALWLAYVSLLAPGDDVLVEDPAYEPLVRTAEGVGAHVIRFAREHKDGFALDADRIARAMTPRTKVVAVTDLHNPSGVRAGEDDLRAAARVAEAGGAFLVVDEVYAPFDDLVDGEGVFRGTSRKLAANVVAVSSLTKCYGLGPQRAGWLLGPPEIVARAEAAVTASCGMLPLAHAHLALEAFSKIVPLAQRARGVLAGKRDRVAAWATAHGLSWSAPESGLFGFGWLPRRGDLTPLIEAAAREHEVLVAPGDFFGTPNGFRIAWSAPVDALDEGLARLAEALKLPEPA